MRRLVVLLPLVGCGQLFNLEQLTLDLDAPVPACTMPDAFDTFDDGPATPCGDWAHLSASAASMTWPVRMNGQLVITPAVGVAASATCTARQLMPFGKDGVWVEVSAVPATAGYAVLSIDTYTTFSSAKNATTKVAGSSGGLGMFDHPSNMRFGMNVPWYPPNTRWWRMRPDNDGHTIVGEVSGDFTTWTEVGRRDLPDPETASFLLVLLGAGRNDTTSDVGKATFESFDICP